MPAHGRRTERPAGQRRGAFRMPTTTIRSATMATTPLVPRDAVDWRVTITTPSGMLAEQVVTASYFREDGRLTVLKTADHQTVYAIVTDRLVSIERKPAA